jgi:HlyD family secretion protein
VVSDVSGILKIPSQALRFRPNDTGPPSGLQGASQAAAAASSTTSATVWLVGDGGRPKPVAVRTGVSEDNSAELLEGALAEDQQVIIGIANAQKQRSYFGLRLGF